MGFVATVSGVGSFGATVDQQSALLASMAAMGPKGDKGDTGGTGATGPQGPAGTAATIAVGTTSTLAPGASATVANSGTSSAAVFNFGIPEGEKGDKGDTGDTGPQGPQGIPGVIAATAPIQYNSGTQTVSIDQSGFLLKADNLTGLASVSTARTNLGLGTIATASASDYYLASNPSGFITSAAAASTYYLQTNPAGYVTAATAPVTSVAGKTGAVSLAVADISGAAPEASPTFTGDPKAPTPSTSDNDTSIATTAFVNSYCPAASTTVAGKVELATILEAHTGSSTTLAVTPDDLAFRIHSGSTLYLNPASASSTVSNGSTFTSSQGVGVRTGTASGSYGMLSFGGNTTNGFSATVANDSVVNFAKRMIFSGKAQVRSASDAGNYVQRVQFGKTQTTTPIGNLAVAGVGFRSTGAGNAIVLMVHNGTTLTTVTSSFTPTAAQAFDWQIHSNGSGNVTLYVNGSSVATSSAGPTGDSTSLPCVTVETEATAAVSAAGNSALLVCNLRVSFDL